jgi:hypothetical protein
MEKPRGEYLRDMMYAWYGVHMIMQSFIVFYVGMGIAGAFCITLAG